MIMGHVFVDRVPKRGFAEEDHAIQALCFDGAHEPFGIGIEIG
jgi:hypothetical protein